jgi:Flp pilus assembly protein TadG
MISFGSRARSECGAVLVHIAVGMIALIAFGSLVVDYGVLWASRRQAQNAADAAALSAGTQLAFGDPTNHPAAANAAIATAAQNPIWAQPPSITGADVTFPACPPGAPASGPCVRANVFRNQDAGNPLPMYLGQIVGLTTQNVRATATAQVLYLNTAQCVKPFAIADKWIENYPTPKPWDTTLTFDKYQKVGNTYVPLPNPDVYVAPTATSTGTGFTLANDYGLQLTLKNGGPQDTLQPGWYYPVDFPNTGPGGAAYRSNIANCNTYPVGPGTVLNIETGNMVGPTKQGMSELYNLDPTAYWDPTANGGKGAPAGGCMAAGTCSMSPRLVAIPLFDNNSWADSKQNGSITVTISHVLGFWINQINAGGDVTGYLTYYPGTPSGTPSPIPTFLSGVILVR